MLRQLIAATAIKYLLSAERLAMSWAALILRRFIRAISRTIGTNPGINFFLFEHPASPDAASWHSMLFNPLIDGFVCDAAILAYFLNSQPTVFHCEFLVAQKVG
jgi:hypothetical protein